MAGQAALAQALALGGRMLDAARQAQWEQVAELDEARSALLHGDEPPGPGTRALLLQLVEQNRIVLALAGEARAAAAQELGRHRHAHHALRSYVALTR
ncbi:flagellar protein FliT [Frateuria defendens]|uniref:flagellar protein FliT n=1 Tax=Frateuria defendens TaxID=2219559 RepID=UPI00066FCAFD|nr:flagellar protein FliT [Frateuria defendens]